MTIDKEQIKKALDRFEEDDFVDSKETLRQEIRSKVKDYLNKELELSGGDESDSGEEGGEEGGEE